MAVKGGVPAAPRSLRVLSALSWLLTSCAVGCYSAPRTPAYERALAMQPHGETRDAAPLDGREAALDDLITRAKRTSPKLALLRARANRVRAEVAAAAPLENPELRVSGVRIDEIVADEPEVNVRLRVRPPRPVEGSALQAEAEAKATAAEADVLVEERRIEARVRRLVSKVRALHDALDAVEDVSELRRELAQKLAARLEDSRATELEQAIAELDAEQAYADWDELRAEYEEELGELGDIVGGTFDPESSSFDAAPAPIAPDRVPAEETLVSAAIRREPRLAVAAAKLDEANARGAAERARQWPWLSFVDVGYVFEPARDDRIAGTAWQLGAGLTVPVFDWNQGAVDAADAASVEASSAYDARLSDLVTDVRAARRELVAAARSVRELESRSLSAARRATEASRGALEVGESDDLADVRVRLREAMLLVGQARRLERYWTAAAKLESLTGWAPGDAPHGRVADVPPKQ